VPSSGAETPFLRRFILFVFEKDNLPRQARDRYRDRYRGNRSQAFLSAGGRTQYLKDLTAVTDVAGLGRCVLVDNNPLSFICNPSNGIPVPDFVGKPVRKRSFSHRLLYKNDEFYQDGLGTKMGTLRRALSVLFCRMMSCPRF
jgi:hypothetical protein